MSRVLKVRPGRPIPAQDTKLALRMTKLVKPGEEIECPECIVAVDGLFWQDSVTREFDIASDITEYVEFAGYPGGYYPLHFWLHAAKLVGEICDEEVIWEILWLGGGTGPTVWTDGPYIIVYPPMSDSTRDFLELYEGTLSITATVKGVEYGPINLIIEEEPYGY